MISRDPFQPQSFYDFSLQLANRARNFHSSASAYAITLTDVNGNFRQQCING